MWPRDEILCALLAAASKQHTPIAPSPLNPTLCESDIILGRHIYQLRKTRPVTRRPPEISPTLRFLKRKAYFEYQAHAAAHKRAGGGDTVVIEAEVVDECEESADVADCCGEEGAEERMPAALIVESGSLLHVVQFDYARRRLIADIEKQMTARRPLPRWKSRQQRLQFFLVLCLMSACLTILTVFSLGALKTTRYLPG
ncbi:unnamed protein product [Discula destructiva]